MSDGATTPDRPRDLPPWTPRAVLALVLLAAVTLTVRHGLGAALIGLAGCALVLCIWQAFRAIQAITEPDDGALLLDLPPTPAQARKTTALRALKDLDFEKAIGNLDEADFAELEQRYREEAKRAMRDVDEERRALRARAELLAQEALEAAPTRKVPPEGEPSDAKASAGASMAENAKAGAKTAENAKASAKTVACGACDTKNEPDARFCKQCGEKLGGKAPAREEASS